MTRSGARRRWPLVVVGLLVLAGLAWWLLVPRPRLAPFTKPVDVTGRSVTVTYTGSACQDRSRLDIDEQRDRVVLTVQTWISAGSCNDVGVTYRLSGQLSSDLGGRPLVDGACEEPAFRSYGDCQRP